MMRRLEHAPLAVEAAAQPIPLSPGRVTILRGDARQLPLPDGSVDLICTSPPYWRQRDYRDGAASMPGQIGNESTWQDWLAVMVTCVREWKRVLKPTGNMFINCGDKYTDKGLLGLPWRLLFACTDDVGLIHRRDIVWHKTNGLPESVTDRCRTSHEFVFHLVKSPRYYAAIDEIREAHLGRHGGGQSVAATAAALAIGNPAHRQLAITDGNPLGKLPGSVWSIPSQPLTVPPHLGVDHFAAFPVELPRRIVLGWSPPGVCTACGQGRRPVTSVDYTKPIPGNDLNGRRRNAGDATWSFHVRREARATITGYVCACWRTPLMTEPDIPPPATPDGPDPTGPLIDWESVPDVNTDAESADPAPPHHDHGRTESWTTTSAPTMNFAPPAYCAPAGAAPAQTMTGWQLPPTRPAVVLDPFAGTGTTLLAADAYGRHAIGIDRSADYCRLAQWRVHDPAERAKALQVPKPPPVNPAQDTLFTL